MLLKRYWPSIKQYIWIVLVCTVLCAIVGGLLAKSQPTAYIGTSVIIVSAGAPGTTYLGATAAATDSISQAANDAAEIPTRSVMSFVYQFDPKIAARHYSVTDLLLDVLVAAPSTTSSILTITTTTPNVEDAQLLATDVANGYQAYKQKLAQNDLDMKRGILQDQIKTLTAQKDYWEKQVESLASSTAPQYTVYNNNLADTTQALRAQENTLLQLPPTVKSDIFVVQVPQLTDITASPKGLIIFAVTVGVGLLLGFIIMLFVIFLDNRLRGDDLVKEKLGLSYIGGLFNDKEGASNPLQGSGVFTKQLTDMCANLRLTGILPGQWRTPQGAILLVTSARMAEGKTTVAVGMAAAAARGGRTVLIIDGNVHEPGTHLALGINPSGFGLSGLLKGMGQDNLDSAVQRSNIPGLWLLPAGAPVDDPAMMLEQRLPGILTQLRKKSDLIIIDGPSLLSSADASLMASMVDGVALVLDSRHDKIPLLLRVKELLSSLTHTPVGVVLNRQLKQKANFYYAATPSGSTSVAANISEHFIPVVSSTSNGNMNGNGNGNGQMQESTIPASANQMMPPRFGIPATPNGGRPSIDLSPMQPSPPSPFPMPRSQKQ